MRTVYWENDALYAIDQTAIPYKEVYLRLETVDSICDAIYKLIIRGAPCIGVSGAFAVAMAAKEAGTDDTREAFAYMKEKAPVIAKTRPTATNLSWAVDVMMGGRVLRKACGAGAADGGPGGGQLPAGL